MLSFWAADVSQLYMAVRDGTDRLETSKDNLLQKDCPNQYPGQWIFPDVNQLRLLPG